MWASTWPWLAQRLSTHRASRRLSTWGGRTAATGAAALIAEPSMPRTPAFDGRTCHPPDTSPVGAQALSQATSNCGRHGEVGRCMSFRQANIQLRPSRYTAEIYRYGHRNTASVALLSTVTARNPQINMQATSGQTFLPNIETDLPVVPLCSYGDRYLLGPRKEWHGFH
jgi:hypothetical protein